MRSEVIFVSVEGKTQIAVDITAISWYGDE